MCKANSLDHEIQAMLTYIYFEAKGFGHTDSSSQSMKFSNQIYFKIKGKITGPWNKDHSDLHLIWSQRSRHTDSLSTSVTLIHRNNLQDNRQILWTVKYRSAWPMFIFRSKVESLWLIIWKNDVHPSNSLQDIRQNHWTVKYRSLWPIFVLRSKIVLH